MSSDDLYPHPMGLNAYSMKVSASDLLAMAVSDRHTGVGIV